MVYGSYLKDRNLFMKNPASEIFTPADLKTMELEGNHIVDRLRLRHKEFRLWEGQAPVTVPEDADLTEHFNDLKGGGFNRLTDITVPTVTYFPASGSDPRGAVIVCPGGGYGYLAWEHEGIAICNWLNTIGFSAFLLKYRCPKRREAAFADGARAVRFIKANKSVFNVSKVGCIGFSAGGHLSATLSAPGDRVPYPAADEYDKLSFVPDFAMLLYPAYLTEDDGTIKEEFTIDATVPPTFIVQTEDDSVRVENGLFWYLALKRAGVPVEMHLFPDGGHGYSLHLKNKNVSVWPKLAETWLAQFA